MVKNRFLVFVAIVLGLTMVTSAMVARTYAKYTTTVTATGSVTVAKWVANFKDGEGKDFADNEFDLFETFDVDGNDSGVNGTLLAPGTSGQYQN
jgi:hypothetical protein